MKYKYIRLRIIIPTLIFILAVVLVLLFFCGGLQKGSLIVYENIEWTEDGFLTPEKIKKDNTEGFYFNNGGSEPVALQDKVYVGQSENFAMYFNENTTIVSVYKKLEGWEEPIYSYIDNTDKEELVCVTAQPNGGSAESMSNITVYYYDENGKENTSGLNAYDLSVLYENRLLGKEKHYKIRYDKANNTVDVCYQIGEFSNIYSTFPKYYDRATYEDTFVGNTFFKYYADSDLKTNGLVNIYDESGNQIVASGYQLGIQYDLNSTDERKKYGMGVCFDNECVLYMFKNNLITFADFVSNVGEKTITFNEIPADEDEILKKDKSGYWLIYGIVDEQGKSKFVLGENYNCPNSPIEMNPFLTSSMITTLFDNNYYEAKYDNNDPNTPNPSQNIYARDHVFKDGEEIPTYIDSNGNEVKMSKGYMEFKADNTITSNILYNYLVVDTPSSFTTSQKLPSYLADENYPDLLKGFNGSHIYQTASDKITAYYDYNGDGILTEDEGYVYGGYHYRDKQGNYLYIDENNYVFYFDANGNRMLNDDEGNPVSVDSTAPYKPFQSGLTTEMASEQNREFSMTSQSQSIAFQVALRFTLSEQGLDVKLINNSIIEGLGKNNTDEEVESYFKHNNVISKIEMCKFMTVNNDPTAEGKIIIPDGSGAVISFNTPKSNQYVDKYNTKRIYGDDTAINRETQGKAQEKIMFPMYGFLDNSNDLGIVAIIRKGAAQSAITANYMTAGNTKIDGYNYAYFTTFMREAEDVKITSNSSYIKTSEKLYGSDIEYCYHLLDGENLTYVDVANDYRNYLIEEYNLSEKKDETKVATPTIAFIGAYLKKTITMGIVHDAERSLTTFKQAASIVQELTDKGVNSMNVSYLLWTDEEGFDPVTTKVDTSSVLGGKKDLIELSKELQNLGYNLFLEYNSTRGYGYDLPFGSLKYNSKSISGSSSNVLDYVLSTGLQQTGGKVGGRVSPAYYQSLVAKYLANYNKLGISGIYLSDLGNSNTSDYSKSNQIYSGDGLYYQKDTLNTAQENNVVMLKSPFDYAINYADVANGVPIETTLYPIVDYSIPFYQLVVSGILDYTSKAINYNNDNSNNWNLLKAIETGSNLYFEISYEDTSALLDTNYTKYYNSYYANWKENIIYMNDVLNSTGIYESYLVGHEYITDTLVRVKYANGISILINYSNNNYYNAQEGISVRGNWFAIEPKEGE